MLNITRHGVYPVAAAIIIAIASVGIQAVTAASKPAVLRITTASLPAWTSGTPATFKLVAVGGTPPLVWSVKSGKLPGGFKLSPDGVISGTSILPAGVTKKVFASFIVQVKDKKKTVKTAKFSITVKPPPPSITVTNPPDLTVGESVNVTIGTAASGISPYKFATQDASGPMPFGMKITTVGSEAHLMGAPKAKGHFAFRLCVTDATKTERCGDIAFDVKDKVTSETWQGTITTTGRCNCTHASGNGCSPGDGYMDGSVTFTFTIPETMAEAVKHGNNQDSYNHRGTGTASGSETVAKQQVDDFWNNHCTLVGGSSTNVPIEVTINNSQGTWRADESAAVVFITITDESLPIYPGGWQTPSSNGVGGRGLAFQLSLPSLEGDSFSGQIENMRPGTGTFTLTKVQ